MGEDVPKNILEKYNLTPKLIRDNLKLTKIPGFLALPYISRDDCPGAALADNVFFKEDIKSPEKLFEAVTKKIVDQRSLEPVVWVEQIQDLIIAGLLCMTYSTFVFPLRTLEEASKALYLQTEEQAAVMNQQDIPKRTICGPAGSGNI